MNRYIFEFGKFKIEWYSVLIIVGTMIAISMILKEAKKHAYSTDYVFNMCFWAIIFGIVGARAWYCLFNMNLYTNFLDVFKIWEGGLAIHGGLIAGIIVIAIYSNKYRIRPIRMFDFCAPAVLLAQSIGRWGNFFNSEAHGPVTSLTTLTKLHIPKFIIDGMNIEGVYYHPTFLYESLWCLIGVIILIIIRRLKITKVGQVSAMYLMWYGLGRFFIESLRTDSLMLGGFKVAQIISVIMILIGVIIIMISSRKGRFEDLYNQDDNQVVRF